MGAVRLLAAVTLGAMAVSPARATPIMGNALDGDAQGWFYNRPGVELSAYKADLAHCQGVAAALTAGSSTVVSADPLTALIGTLVVAAIDAAQDVGRRQAYTDDCMVVAGYRRFDVKATPQKALTARFDAMDEASLVSHVAAETPRQGVLGREWANSYLAVREDAPAVSEPSLRLRPSAIAGFGNLTALKEIKPGKPIAVAAGEALIVASLRNAEEARALHALGFTRIDPKSGAHAPVPMGRRGRPSTPTFGLSMTASRAKGVANVDAPSTFVFAAPAGHYALTGYTGAGQSVQMCLRTIAFEAPAGGVVHIGDWTSKAGASDIQAGALASNFVGVPNPNIVKVTTAAKLSLDGFDLDRARAALKDAPGDLAGKLAPAVWMNGAASPCLPSAGAMAYGAAYGFELAGAPALNPFPASAPVAEAPAPAGEAVAPQAAPVAEPSPEAPAESAPAPPAEAPPAP